MQSVPIAWISPSSGDPTPRDSVACKLNQTQFRLLFLRRNAGGKSNLTALANTTVELLTNIFRKCLKGIDNSCKLVQKARKRTKSTSQINMKS